MLVESRFFYVVLTLLMIILNVLMTKGPHRRDRHSHLQT